MIDHSQLREQMEVVRSDGAHVGAVDHPDEDWLKLTEATPTRKASTTGGRSHRWIR